MNTATRCAARRRDRMGGAIPSHQDGVKPRPRAARELPAACGMTPSARRWHRLGGTFLTITSSLALWAHLAGALDLGRDSWVTIIGIAAGLAALVSMGRVGVFSPAPREPRNES